MADFKSSVLLNAIKNEASAMYQDRIPDATQDNLAAVGTAILSYNETRNEFVNALLNRIGLTIAKNMMFENPLKEFKKGTMAWGKDIEEIFVDIIKAEAFDPALAETTLFKRNMPKVSAVFHRLDRQDVYPQTVQYDDLKLAFTGESGMNDLIAKILQTPYTSDEVDEFLLMKNLIHMYGTEGKFHIVPVTPVIDNATAKAAMVTIKEISNNLIFPTTKYNFAGVTNTTPKDKQIILINTKFDAMVDVEVLAAAFNMDKADFIGRRILVDDFGGLDNVLCAVVDRDWFMVYDSLFSSEDVHNPKGRYYNYFLHHWQVLSTSPFSNAVLFVTVAPELTAITLTPATATVVKGGSLQFNVEATGTGNPSSKCTYTHDGTDSYISSTGLLIVGKNEAVVGGVITVTATSVVDPLISDTAAVTVV
jgi:hypothetical protein